MSQPSHIPGLFTQSGYRVKTCAWHHDILRENASLCKLVRMEFCKTKGDILHEFLTLYFSHPIHTDARAAVVVDRAVKDFPPLSVIVSPSIAFQRTTEALDRVHVLGQGENVESYLSRAYDQYDRLCVLNYPSAESNSSSPTPPSAIQLSTLLLVVTKHRPNYNLYEYNCYWYADTIFEACKKLFPGYRREKCNKHGYRGRWRMKFFMLAMHSLPHICDEYNVEWTKVAKRRENKETITQEEWERRLEEERRVRKELEQELEEMKRLCKQLEAVRPTSLHSL